jgi:hypothetical protein
MRKLLMSMLAAGACLAPAAAGAQEPKLPRWDAGASFGFLWGDGWTADSDPYVADANVAYHFDLGRYWTTHFKTETAVMLTPARSGYDYRPYPGPGYGGGVFSLTDTETTLTAISGAATYQFFENDFMHPFVSAGLQVGTVSQHRVRQPATVTSNRVTYQIPPIDEHSYAVLARPFVAVGAKSYFNERTYVRSELLIGAYDRGFSHATLRLGFGVDF